jgi:hypothetical protein
LLQKNAELAIIAYPTFFVFIFDYSALIAPTGQPSSQAPQSTQSPLIT